MRNASLGNAKETGEKKQENRGAPRGSKGEGFLAAKNVHLFQFCPNIKENRLKWTTSWIKRSKNIFAVLSDAAVRQDKDAQGRIYAASD